MSGYGGRHRSVSVNSRGSKRSNNSQSGRNRMGSYGALTGPTLTPSNDQLFEACAATASFFLYAQRNVILSLHHDTLNIDRRFERHREDVRWIQADNVSHRGAGRLAVSYDVSQTAIVWDMMSGEELARFASYEDIRVAAWMKDGQIAFGNDQGNIIMFDHETKEHYSRKTIYDPITALAPSMDCRVFAIGYANGSILIAALQPAFSIIHSLSTQRHPSPINELSWHGSTSKSKSDMLASQTMDGDLRVWSIPKSPTTDQPSIIRNFQQGGMERTVGPCWFGWSKMGRIVQYLDGQTLAWDVRTKKVTYESVPTIEGVVGIANYGPQAVLFTIGRNHTVQQYDLNPTGTPMLVKNVQHMPATLPPSPPISDGAHMRHNMATATAGAMEQRHSNNLPLYMDTASSEGGEGYGVMSPLERITQDAPSESQSEQSEEERDLVLPMSPGSSRSSNVSRNSDKRPKLAYPSRRERQLSSRLRPPSPGIQSTRSGSTILTSSSTASGGRRTRSSRLRQEVLRSPEDGKEQIDLFPFVRAHLDEVPFRPPRYGDGPRPADMLRVEMLRTVFGWEGDVQDMIRDEISRHEPGSTSAVLLAKWLGELGTEHAPSMTGSESMTSSDWMLLALSAVGGGAQKKVGNAFVQRLLEKGDIHPAVAILLGLGEFQEAIEIYVSRKYYLEAVLLCCLLTPHDWKRQSHLIRKWGEVAITNHEPELAVRCFACTSVDSSETWMSPASKDAVYEAQMQYMGPSPSSAGLSPGASSQASSLGPFSSSRRHPRQAGLKLITDFSGQNQRAGKLPASARDERTPLLMTGVTPIDQTFSPIGRTGRKKMREPTSSMTATPGGLTSMRMPSRGRWVDELVTPIGGDDRTAGPESAIRIKGQHSALLAPGRYANLPQEHHLPSPAAGVFSKESRRQRNMSRDRKPQDLQVETAGIVVIDSAMPSAMPTGTTASSVQTHSTFPGKSAAYQMGAKASPDLPLSAKIASLDAYVNSLATSEERAAEYIQRPESRTRQAKASRSRAPSETGSKRYVRAGKRSPSSPVSMSPDDPGLQIVVQTNDIGPEKIYQVVSPTESSYSRGTNVSKPRGRTKANSVSYGTSGSVRSSSKAPRRGESVDPAGRAASRTRRRDASRPVTPERDTGRRGRSVVAGDISSRRSPDSPVSMMVGGEDEPRTTRRREQSVGDKVRARATSATRQAQSPDRFRSRVRATSMSRRGSPDEQPRMRSQSAKPAERRDPSPTGRTSRQTSRPPIPRLQTDFSDGKRAHAARTLAAQELEARRLSLARRPSAPAIPHPDELIPRSASSLGFMSIYDDPVARSHTAAPELSSRRMTNRMTGSERMGPSEHDIMRSHTVDPEAQRRHIGLPETPKAMRLPSRYDQHDAPAVPQIPSGYHGEPPNEHLMLPSTTFTLPSTSFNPINRAASAPPEKYDPGHARRGSRQERRTHSRMGSLNEIIVPPPPPPVSRDAVISYPPVVSGTGIFVVRDSGSHEEVLPQLQHLMDQHGPPPPPPPPPAAPAMAFRPLSHVSNSSAGVISIAIDEVTGAAVAQSRNSAASQTSHARRPSADTAASHSYEQVHPQQQQHPVYYNAPPYESIRPPFERVGSAPPQSLHASSLSLDGALAGPSLQLLPSTTYQPHAAPAQHRAHQNPSLASGPRDPKQIRAAMTAEQLQFGMSATGPQLLPATTYLPERPQTAAPQSGVVRPRGLEEYRSPSRVRANMPPVSTQHGAGFLEGRPF